MDRRKHVEILFSSQHKFLIANRFFQENKDRYWTWESPDGKTRYQIDYILSNQKGIIQDCEVITRADMTIEWLEPKYTSTTNKKLTRLIFIKKEKKRKINILKLQEKRPDL